MTLVPHPSGKGDPGLSTADAGFELLEEFRVTGGSWRAFFTPDSLDIAPDKNHCRW
jgi:hypothetical protein